MIYETPCRINCVCPKYVFFVAAYDTYKFVFRVRCTPDHNTDYCIGLSNRLLLLHTTYVIWINWRQNTIDNNNRRQQQQVNEQTSEIYSGH